PSPSRYRSVSGHCRRTFRRDRRRLADLPKRNSWKRCPLAGSSFYDYLYSFLYSLIRCSLLFSSFESGDALSLLNDIHVPSYQIGRSGPGSVLLELLTDFL